VKPLLPGLRRKMFPLLHHHNLSKQSKASTHTNGPQTPDLPGKKKKKKKKKSRRDVNNKNLVLFL
jgi:hypothetical protein